MSSAFHFDVVKLVGVVLDKLLNSGQWKRINYTECYEFSETDPEALAQAELFKTELKQVNNPVTRSNASIFKWRLFIYG